MEHPTEEDRHTVHENLQDGAMSSMPQICNEMVDEEHAESDQEEEEEQEESDEKQEEEEEPLPEEDYMQNLFLNQSVDYMRDVGIRIVNDFERYLPSLGDNRPTHAGTQKFTMGLTPEALKFVGDPVFVRYLSLVALVCLPWFTAYAMDHTRDREYLAYFREELADELAKFSNIEPDNVVPGSFECGKYGHCAVFMAFMVNRYLTGGMPYGRPPRTPPARFPQSGIQSLWNEITAKHA